VIRRALDALYVGAGWLAGLFVLAIFVVMIAQTVVREFGYRTGGTDDIVGWFCAAASFLVLASAFKRGDLVRVTLLLERLAPGARRTVEIFALGAASVFTLFLAYWSIRSTYETWRFDEMAGGLVVIPLWIPQLSLPIGASLLALAVVDELVRVVRGARPAYQEAIEARHARGDFSEDV
jgi:TRAP-type C4-dicarboxylate transport system permease small subunit